MPIWPKAFYILIALTKRYSHVHDYKTALVDCSSTHRCKRLELMSATPYLVYGYSMQCNGVIPINHITCADTNNRGPSIFHGHK